jgi:hypothetical protein
MRNITEIHFSDTTGNGKFSGKPDLPVEIFSLGRGAATTSRPHTENALEPAPLLPRQQKSYPSPPHGPAHRGPSFQQQQERHFKSHWLPEIRTQSRQVFTFYSIMYRIFRYMDSLLHAKFSLLPINTGIQTRALFACLVPAWFGLFRLFSHRILLNQPKSAGFQISRTPPRVQDLNITSPSLLILVNPKSFEDGQGCCRFCSGRVCICVRGIGDFAWCYDYLNMGLVIYIFIFSLVILANYQFLTRHVYLYAINLILILLNLLIMT